MVDSPDAIPASVAEQSVQAPPEGSFLDTYRSNHPDVGAVSDYVLSRHLYDSGMHGKDEAYPAFASRIGVSQAPVETLANTGLTTAGLGLANPIESGLSGLGALLSGGSFGEGYKTKRQELTDQSDVGAYQNPASSTAGNIAGTVADYMKLGPAFRAAGDMLPGVAKFANRSPLTDAVVKLFGLSEANEIPKVIEREALRPDGPSPSAAAGDLAVAGLEGAGSAVVGSGVSKALSAVAGPLVRSVGQGLIAADDAAKGIPRSIYTKGATKLSSGFTGETSPAAAAHGIDTKFYDSLLDNSAIDSGKAIDDLTQRMLKPGWESRVLQAAKTAAPASDKSSYDLALTNLDEGISNPDSAAATALRNTIVRLQASDPSGQLKHDFFADIYKELIPARLSGSFDPAGDFDRNLISGALSDKGQLIKPPVSGMGALGQQIYERTGGGPGRVMWPLVTPGALKSTLGGALAVGSQAATLPGRIAGYGLDAAGKAIGAAGEPGEALSRVAADGFGPRMRDGLNAMPNAYQGVLAGMLHGAHSDFPDTYTPPVAQQHAEMPSGAQVQAWLGSTDRASAAAYVGSKLGPQAAQQIAATDDGGYKAALFSLFSDPASRRALAN